MNNFNLVIINDRFFTNSLAQKAKHMLNQYYLKVINKDFNKDFINKVHLVIDRVHWVINKFRLVTKMAKNKFENI